MPFGRFRCRPAPKATRLSSRKALSWARNTSRRSTAWPKGLGPTARRYLPVATLIALALIWGYSWVPFKIGVVHSSPFVFATLRIIPGGLLMLGLMVVLGKPLRPKAVGLTMLLGLLQTSGFLGFSMMALVSGGAGRTSILANTWQFWVLLMAWPILGERLRGSQWLSVLLGLSGLVLIIAPWHLSGVASALYTLGGAVSWAGSSIVAKVLRRRHTVDLLSLTTWQMLFGAVPLLLLALVFRGDLPDWSAAFDLSLVFTLLVTTCLGSFMWLYALRELPAGIAGLGTLGTPGVRHPLLVGATRRTAHRPRGRRHGYHPCGNGDTLCTQHQRDR